MCVLCVCFVCVCCVCVKHHITPKCYVVDGLTSLSPSPRLLSYIYGRCPTFWLRYSPNFSEPTTVSDWSFRGTSKQCVHFLSARPSMHLPPRRCGLPGMLPWLERPARCPPTSLATSMYVYGNQAPHP